MLRRVALERTKVSEGRIAFITRVTRIDELGMLAADSRHPDGGGGMYLLNFYF
jgi:hypothetical protein